MILDPTLSCPLKSFILSIILYFWYFSFSPSLIAFSLHSVHLQELLPKFCVWLLVFFSFLPLSVKPFKRMVYYYLTIAIKTIWYWEGKTYRSMQWSRTAENPTYTHTNIPKGGLTKRQKKKFSGGRAAFTPNVTKVIAYEKRGKKK